MLRQDKRLSDGRILETTETKQGHRESHIFDPKSNALDPESRSTASGDNLAKKDPGEDLGKYRGGPHSETKLPKGDDLDSHHMPSRQSLKGSGIDPEEAPAIQMEPEHHVDTASHGQQGKAGEVFRNQQRELIQQGKIREAMSREIRDVRSVPNKVYNQAIREMLDYAKSMGWLNK